MDQTHFSLSSARALVLKVKAEATWHLPEDLWFALGFGGELSEQLQLHRASGV